LDSARTENSHRYQRFLPDGRRFLFTARCGQRENNALYLASLDTGQAKRLMPINSKAHYIPPREGGPGVLIYYLEGSLVSRVLDLAREEVSGEPVPVYEGVAYNSTSLAAFFSISDDGRVAVIRPAGANQTLLTWHSRTGDLAGTLGPRGTYNQPRISPDGARVVVSSPDPQTGNRDLFVIEVARGTFSRLTTHVANDWYPVWSPDGKQLLFGSDRDGGTRNLTYLKRSLEPGAEESRFPGEQPVDWSRDGRWISFFSESGRNTDLWIAPALPDGKPFPYLATPFRESTARFSPDTRLVAYTSNETGQFEVYVRPFTGGPAPPEGKIQISTGGGDFPVWKKEGGELYFMAGDSTLFAVNTQDFARSPAVPHPSRLFRACEGTMVQPFPLRDASYDPPYDTLAGKRFLINCAAEAPGRFTVLLNWPFAAKR